MTYKSRYRVFSILKSVRWHEIYIFVNGEKFFHDVSEFGGVKLSELSSDEIRNIMRYAISRLDGA